MSTEEIIREEIKALRRCIEKLEAAIRVPEVDEKEQAERDRLRRLESVDVERSATVLKGRKLLDFSKSRVDSWTVFHFSFDDGSKEQKQSYAGWLDPDAHVYDFMDGSRFVYKNQ